jgi:hypothetical protein
VSPELPEPADRSSRLQLLVEIARGRMGVVLKGRNNDLGRDLAVKVVLAGRGGPVDRNRRCHGPGQKSGRGAYGGWPEKPEVAALRREAENVVNVATPGAK